MSPFTFMIDVDNTLIDNDRAKEVLESEITHLVGEERGKVFWDLYEDVRHEYDYVDLPETLKRFVLKFPRERGVPRMAAFVLGFPYQDYVFPGSIEALGYLKTIGSVVIVSDGDPVFQPAKIARARIAEAVDDNVLIYVHKEEHLDEVFGLYPADQYVLVDDKPTILAATKRDLGDKVIAVHIKKGKYASSGRDANADLDLDSFADITDYSADDLRASTKTEAPTA